jgi:hypothetical protein
MTQTKLGDWNKSVMGIILDRGFEKVALCKKPDGQYEGLAGDINPGESFPESMVSAFAKRFPDFADSRWTEVAEERSRVFGHWNFRTYMACSMNEYVKRAPAAGMEVFKVSELPNTLRGVDRDYLWLIPLAINTLRINRPVSVKIQL